MTTHKRDEARLDIRIPRELHDRLMAAAAERRPRQSLTREVVARLYASFNDRPNDATAELLADPEFRAELDKMIRELLNGNDQV